MQLASSALFLCVVCYSTQGSRIVYHNEDSQPNELDMMELFIGEPSRPSLYKRSENYDKDAKAAGLWFGPRLGRRRRSVGQASDRTRRSIDDGTPSKQALYLGQDGQWTVMTFGGGKRDSNFSPRLGRHLDEDLLVNLMEPMFGNFRPANPPDGGAQPVNNAGSNFTPRLGRLAPLEQH